MSSKPINNNDELSGLYFPPRIEDLLDEEESRVSHVARTALDFKGSKSEDESDLSEEEIIPSTRYQNWTLEDFQAVGYSHPTIARQLRDSEQTITDLFLSIRDHGWSSKAEPITLIEYEPGKYVSWNNRRLFCLKEMYKLAPDASIKKKNWSRRELREIERTRPLYYKHLMTKKQTTVPVKIVSGTYFTKLQDFTNLQKTLQRDPYSKTEEFESRHGSYTTKTRGKRKEKLDIEKEKAKKIDEYREGMKSVSKDKTSDITMLDNLHMRACIDYGKTNIPTIFDKDGRPVGYEKVKVRDH